MNNPIEYTVKVWANGDRYWYLNGKEHREDGPAIEYADGTRLWYLNGKLHREDGPAIENANGDRLWYLNGKRLSEAEHAKEVAKLRNPNAELIERLAKAEAEVAAVRKELGDD